MIATLWLKYRKKASDIFRKDVWPKLQAQTQCQTGKLAGISLEFVQLDIGDRAPTVDTIKTTSDAGSGEIIVDLVAAYRGNAVASGTLQLSPLQIPVTLSKVSFTNIKMRIIFKGVVDKFPMINGVQVFLLEPPKLDWSSDFATKVTLE